MIAAKILLIGLGVLIVAGVIVNYFFPIVALVGTAAAAGWGYRLMRGDRD